MRYHPFAPKGLICLKWLDLIADPFQNLASRWGMFTRLGKSGVSAQSLDLGSKVSEEAVDYLARATNSIVRNAQNQL